MTILQVPEASVAVCIADSEEVGYLSLSGGTIGVDMMCVRCGPNRTLEKTTSKL